MEEIDTNITALGFKILKRLVDYEDAIIFDEDKKTNKRTKKKTTENNIRTKLYLKESQEKVQEKILFKDVRDIKINHKKSTINPIDQNKGGWVTKEWLLFNLDIKNGNKIDDYLNKEKYKISNFIERCWLDLEHKIGKKFKKSHLLLYRLKPSAYRHIHNIFFTNKEIALLEKSDYYNKQCFNIVAKYIQDFVQLVTPHENAKIGAYYSMESIILYSDYFNRFINDNEKFNKGLNYLNKILDDIPELKKDPAKKSWILFTSMMTNIFLKEFDENYKVNKDVAMNLKRLVGDELAIQDSKINTLIDLALKNKTEVRVKK